MRHSLLTLTLLALPATVHAATLAQLRDHRRVLVIAAPAADDPKLVAQREMLVGWREGAADRDVSTVEVIGDAVGGADDAAAALRSRLALPARAFAVVLIGKDGHVALRSATPLPAGRVEAAIDAMPMRKAGQR